jgi:DNA-binding transcriptional LysR family regulator
MNYRHLEVFFTVMTSKTVTEAARKLCVSQPSISTTISHAEAQMGITLFLREGGRLVPTQEAQVLFEEAERAHDALTAFEALARRLKVSRGGHVRIAAIPSISLELLPDAIELFQQNQAGFNYSISTLNTEEILDKLDSRKGTFHLGFSLGNLETTGLGCRIIGETDVLAVFPADWELPSGGEISLTDFGEAPFVASFAATSLGQLTKNLFVEAGVEPPVVARIHTHQLAGRLVQKRLGFALLDAVTVRALLHDRMSDAIVVRRIKGLPTIPVSVMFPGNRSLSNAAQLFLECFQEAYDNLTSSVEDKLP